MSASVRLRNRIHKIVKKYALIACDRVQTEWGRLQYIDGDAVIDKEVTKAKNYVTAVIYAYGQRAWIAEYGRGSLMDSASENPYLMDYLKSDIINPARTGKAIVGRPKGAYPNLDRPPKMHTSTGTMRGVNLEVVHHKGENKYYPIQGKHIINHILFGGYTVLQKMLQAGGHDVGSGKGVIPEMFDEIQQAIRQELLSTLQSIPKEIGMAKR